MASRGGNEEGKKGRRYVRHETLKPRKSNGVLKDEVNNLKDEGPAAREQGR